LFPRIADWSSFAVRVALICQLIFETIKGVNPKRHLVSIDEKTGIQALSRNGTTCLIAAFDIGTGKISHALLTPTRKEDDFARFIEDTIQKYPIEDEIILMVDQLNTHQSESLVLLIANKIGFKGELGIKGEEGILKSQETRRVFLEDDKHSIRVLYTPKHCSWLNPIENWFAKLQRQALTHGNFESVLILNKKIADYIDYYNNCLVKPLKWKFKGFQKKAP
jgi:DDE superfamily endonuclease